MAYGTLSTLDSLATLTAASGQSVAAFGEDRAFATIIATLAAHNALLLEADSALVERTTDRLRRYGGNDTINFEELDQWGTPNTQKVAAGVNVGAPLRLYGTAVQWTRKYFQVATPAELAAQFTAALNGDLRNRMLQLKRAIFTPTNSNFTDKLVDQVVLPLKAFLNADGAAIPSGPNGETFSPNQTHYLASATGTLALADVTGLLNTVVEHYSSGEVQLYINQAQEATIRALAGFQAYVDSRIIQASTASYAQGGLDMMQIYNRSIGILAQARVSVKPWMPANYLFAFVDGAPAPLMMRTRNAGSGDMELVYDAEEHPLRARALEREFGIGVWNRTNGAALAIVANATYVAPTLTASFNAG
ncbi:MAG TPA: hypothetical protein VNM48_03880 [Chloroflexota bacterium]|nr:hypothetical protein [Chloroflexota bacterium]